MSESEREDLSAIRPEASLAGWGIRTFLVFLDLPKHVEFRAGQWPVLEVGSEVDLDLTIKDPRDPRKSRVLKGLYRVERRVLRYSNGRASRSGLSQYLEIGPSGPAGGS